MKLIMAMSLNGVIGIDRKLPWDVPGDRCLVARRSAAGPCCSSFQRQSRRSVRGELRVSVV